MWIDELEALIALPRADQYAALKRIRDAAGSSYEQWNTDFSPASLYGAWTKLPIMQSLYRDNRTVIMKALDGRSDWHIVELGGGTGALWEGFFDEGSAGTFTLIDPHPQAHTAVAARLPQGVVFDPVTIRRRACRDTGGGRHRLQSDAASRRRIGRRPTPNVRSRRRREGRSSAALCRGDPPA